MDKYISLDEAKKAAAQIAMTSGCREMTCGELKKIMDAIPPVSIRFVKEGTWQDYPSRLGEQCQCPFCKQVFWAYMKQFPFCPQCGNAVRKEQKKCESESSL